jgi:hypothetical protein
MSSKSSVVQVVFILLKLLGLINWSWWWVLSPSLIDLAIVAIVLVVVLWAKHNKA